MANAVINRRNIGIVLVLAALFYLAMVLWSNWQALWQVFASARPGLLLLVFACTLGGYVFRFTNWQFYLRTLGVTAVPRYQSAWIFFGGFGLGITPGKVGEFMRFFYLRERFGIPLARTSGILLVDRLTDLCALVVIAAVGVLQFAYGLKVLLAVIALVLLILGVLTYHPAGEGLIRLVCKPAKLQPVEGKLLEAYDSARELLRPGVLGVILICSLIAWSFEALGFWVAFHALGISGSFLVASFIYAFSTIVGAVALLPGGLGLTEGSMTGLLLAVNVVPAAATAATLLIRAATLWFGVGIGAVCLAVLEHKPGSHTNKS